MPTAEQLWTWISPAVKDIRDDVERNPGKPLDARKQVMIDRLGMTDAESHPVTATLMKKLGELPEAERDSVLGSDRMEALVRDVIREHAEPEPVKSTGPGYDKAAWQPFLTTYGRGWDGTEGSWAGFCQWFKYYADAAGLSVPATRLLTYMQGLSVPDRISAFRQYQVVITVAQPGQQVPGQQAPAASSGDELGWVTKEQGNYLGYYLGQDWRAALSRDLAARWGQGWQANPGAHKAAWLADLITSGAFTGSQAPATPSRAPEASAAVPQQSPMEQESPVERQSAAPRDEIAEEFAAMVRDIPGIESLSDDEIAQIIAEEMGEAGS